MHTSVQLCSEPVGPLHAAQALRISRWITQARIEAAMRGRLARKAMEFEQEPEPEGEIDAPPIG